MLILDTNIVSLLIRDSKQVLQQYDETLDRGEILGISGMTYYELQLLLGQTILKKKYQICFSRTKLTIYLGEEEQ